MLTGEAVPIIKVSLPYNDKKYNPIDENKNSTLFCGTQCIETRYYLKGKVPVLGLVTHTGFNTMKGQLIRSIMFPKNTSFQFYRDSLKFIGVMSLFAVLGFSYSIVCLVQDNAGVKEMIDKTLDMITVTVPPALPTCMSIGISFAAQRLKRKNIFCIAPSKINVAGKINIMCFDKTGTLTEDGLDTYGILSSSNNSFTPLLLADQIEAENGNQNHNKILQIMASCQAITTINGQFIGDPLDIKMFQTTGWQLHDQDIPNHFDEVILAIISPPKAVANQNKDNDDEIGIIRRFDFSSKLQRMSVIASHLHQADKGKKFELFIKGSPEKIRSLCVSDSIPSDYNQQLEQLAKCGYRILACGHRYLKQDYRKLFEIDREKLEKRIRFIGFLIMENKLKPITKSIIEKLEKAYVRTVMVTGDNILTAISVARQCCIVHQNQSVYLGDLSEKKINGRYVLEWKDFDNNQNTLNPETLSPNNEDENANNKQKEQVQIKIDNSDISNDLSEALLSRDMKEEEDEEEITNFQSEEKMELPIWFGLGSEEYRLAITGRAFSYLINEVKNEPEKYQILFQKMLEKTQIFARMKPEEKALLVSKFQDCMPKSLVGMCGDGANDCNALKTGHIGVSLSEAEASIAAPFTSKIQDISCIIKILREGRCALSVSFQCFKFMALYSMIQFATVTLLYSIHSNLGDNQFLYVDLILIFPLAIFMGYTKAYKKLTKSSPSATLLCFPVLLSVIGQIFFQIAGQVAIYAILLTQPWFKKCHAYVGEGKDENEYYKCYENTTLYCFANIQYIVTCLAFSIGKPFRKEFYTNYSFLFCLIALTFFSLYQMIIPDKHFAKFFGLVKVSWGWRFYLIGGTLINTFITLFYEKFGITFFVKMYQKQKARKEREQQKTEEKQNLQILEQFYKMSNGKSRQSSELVQNLRKFVNNLI
eukprot:TRINITY_DN2221_c0_g1_i11.p1 TRINITY_DN2221_c0_g1~~TRINITY_DN2221_c0_g1_i11.p1  ORF type:complete len:932 (+),score=102.30 TRINITY_DN2221_c0_g1_i11:723-3518(+)